jgi:AraC-like DNA-binding protein
VPLPILVRAWDEAVQRSGDEALGLHLGEQLPLGALSALDYLCQHARTLRDVFTHLARFQRLINDAVVMTIEDRGADTILHHRLDFPPRGAPRAAAEMALSGWITRARQLSGVDVVPKEVRFRHAQPAAVAEHRRIFRAPIRFGCPESSLVLDRATAALPVVARDAGLALVLERHVEALIARLPASDSLVSRVRRAASDLMATGSVGPAAVAARLGVSPRTLQRRLADEGTTLEKVLDTLRCELAARYLREERMSIAEAALLLGYSEPSAFHRAFRRWTGTTPDAWRCRPP